MVLAHALSGQEPLGRRGQARPPRAAGGAIFIGTVRHHSNLGMTAGGTLSLNGGDVERAVGEMATTGTAGALLRIEMKERARRHPVDRRDGDLQPRVWTAAVAALPLSVVGRQTAWSMFEFALEGKRFTLAPLGARLLSALRVARVPTECAWHLVFIEVFPEAERTLWCDPGYDLRARDDKTLLAWVKPYRGADWRQPRRYPRVTFLALED